MGFDEDNPKWTDADFGRANAPEELPAEVLAAFPNTGKRMGVHRDRRSRPFRCASIAT